MTLLIRGHSDYLTDCYSERNTYRKYPLLWKFHILPCHFGIYGGKRRDAKKIQNIFGAVS